MKQYLDLMDFIMKTGVDKGNRTGTDTRSVFGYTMRFNLQNGFPLVTTKKLHLKSIIYELIWFLNGDTNTKFLNENGVRIWDEWADEKGELGPVYGKQWRSWLCADGRTIDQISELVHKLKNKPNDRRMIVSAWNVGELEFMALPACHCLFQFYTRPVTQENGEIKLMLDCLLYQRSCDTFLGVPFNIASYALLTMMMAQVSDILPGEFIWVGGDTHLYHNHFDQVHLQMSREPFPLPSMKINPEVKDIFSFKYEDFTLENYQSHSHIKATVAV